MSLIRKKHAQHNSVKTFSPIQKLSAESPEVLSEHLTYLELNQMDRITPDEIVQMVMAREQGGITLSNVNQYVQFSNRISLLVATEILSNSKLSDRVSLIEFFMDTALACCRLGNFNSCMAITAGLSLPVVSRLSKTWLKVEETKFRVLQHICCPEKNFQNYRVILKVYGTESRVMIPIFSVFLKDCFFRLKPCVEGCSESEIELKYWEDLTRPIAEFDSWRSKRIQLTKREKLITYISSTNIHEESSLFRCSFDLEGPNNSFERSQRRKMN